ncbi:hypothetical protein ARMSODRAFT_292388 [Armillaria solidipes]|uniref:Uncharacterized protein n=1 Tax=Armillaria solidipes TaxID=1076256 RepID=A0A2H3BAY2_9AGAR|nr:hypothetical protein ARMSODRAFT_292388 [Armillaria solidipes]
MAVRLCPNIRPSFTYYHHHHQQTTQNYSPFCDDIRSTDQHCPPSRLQGPVPEARNKSQDIVQRRDGPEPSLYRDGYVPLPCIQILISSTATATKTRPHQENKESTAGRAPSPETGYRHSWNQEVLAITLLYLNLPDGIVII